MGYNSIMVEKKITPKEFETYLQEFVGRNLTDFYYITDTLLVFKSGKQYLFDESVVKGKKIQSHHSEHEFRIWGDWKYERDGRVIETSDVKPDEDAPKFRNRMGDFAESIHPNKITDIRVSEDGKETTVVLDNGGQFVVTPSGDSYLNYFNYSFDSNGKEIGNRGVKSAENTGVLTYFEAL